MIKKLLLVASVFYNMISVAQAPAIEWQKCFGGTSGDGASSIQQTTDGGYILASNTESNDGDVTGNHGYDDVWVVKFSALGVLEWQKNLGGTSYDDSYSIQQTTDGGYILAGYTYSNDGDVSGNHGSYDAWVIKLSSSGVIEWQKTYGGPGYDESYSIQQTTDGGYILAGYAESNSGDVPGNHGNGDAWVIKLSFSGDLEWKKVLGGTNSDTAISIRQTSNGGYILAVDTYSTDGDVIGNHGGNDVWVVKLSATGAVEWQKCLGGTGPDFVNSIQQTTDGGYILAGSTYSVNGDVIGNHGYFDAWVVKLTASGVLEWQKTLGGTNNDLANSIQQNIDGSYILAGSTDSNNGDVTGNHGNGDVWVVKLSTLGMLEWQKCLGGTSTDGALNIQQTIDGGYILASNTNSNNGDVTNNHGDNDIWVVKLGPELSTENFDKKSCIIYPNPTTNTLHIQTNQVIDKITITDVTGKKIKEQNTVSNQIDVQDLQQGMYIVQFFSGGKTFVEKFVKE